MRVVGDQFFMILWAMRGQEVGKERVLGVDGMGVSMDPGSLATGRPPQSLLKHGGVSLCNT